jgi:hypothetical protein
VSDAFLMLLTQKVTAGFGGKIALTPRTFLRELVDVLQRVDLHAEWDPAVKYELKLDDGVLTPEEVAATRGEEALPAEGDDTPEPKRRLDG